MKQCINNIQAIIRLVTWTIISCYLISAADADTTEPFTIGVHPFLPSTILIERFTPLADYISSQLHRPVNIAISRDYNNHIKATGEGQFDIAFLGPASYVQLVKRYGQQRLLARLEVKGNPTFHGAIVTRSGSTIKSLAGLKGHSFAFGDKNSTMSSLVPEWMLISANVPLTDLANYSHLANHNDVALGVLLERFDAGAVKEEVFQKYKPRGLQVLAWTPDISEHVFVASQQLPTSLVNNIRNALLNLTSTPEGQHVLTGMKPGLTGLVPATDTDYANLRQILADLGADE